LCAEAEGEFCCDGQATEQGAPEAEPTGGAQRLGKITSNVSVPSTGKAQTDGKC